MREEDCGLLFCIPVDQYISSFSFPFFVPIYRGLPLEEVREAIIHKVAKYDLKFDYGKDHLGNTVTKSLSHDQIQSMILNYAEFKTSRRQIDHSKVTVRDFGKQDTHVEFPKGQNFVNIGLEFNLSYQCDENQRDNGQLKINAA